MSRLNSVRLTFERLPALAEIVATLGAIGAEIQDSDESFSFMENRGWYWDTLVKSFVDLYRRSQLAVHQRGPSTPDTLLVYHQLRS